MPSRDFGGIFHLEDMSDDELRQLIVQQLREYPNVDAGWIDVSVKDGFVTLSGRVGTDMEVQVAEQVIQEVLGIQNYSNELMVDELHRGELPEAVDEAATIEGEMDDHLGGDTNQQSDTAAHLAEDLEDETFGTRDPTRAAEGTTVYIPPDRPTGDGYGSGEQH